MGVIKDGVYYPDEVDKPISTNTVVKDIATDGKLNRQFDDHAHELIQPHNPDGTPNEDFIEYYPDIAKDYGFIKERE